MDEEMRGAKYVTVEVHREFERRIEAENQRRDDENDRQNHRIASVEAKLGQISELVTSVKLLANNMERMAKEQEKQGQRLDAIEQKPAKRWDSAVGAIITGIIGIFIGIVSAGLMP